VRLARARRREVLAIEQHALYLRHVAKTGYTVPKELPILGCGHSHTQSLRKERRRAP
jgi:hypothetical protein